MITVEGLEFMYPGASAPALHGVDFQVEDGEVFGLLGPSGAGKSTTQKVLTGTLRGHGGRVEVLGGSPGGAAFYSQIGVSFEYPNVHTRLSARENLDFFAALYPGPTDPADDLLDLVGLSDDAHMRVSDFSKGMRMRLNLARALLNRPRLLFLDEPTSGQDPANARRIKRLVRDQAAQGRTVLLTTHDMSVAADVCDRVGFIVDGTLRAVASPRALMLEHGRREVRVEHQSGREARFELDGLGDNDEFLAILRTSGVETIHTLEATLEDVFIAVTGRRLS